MFAVIILVSLVLSIRMRFRFFTSLFVALGALLFSFSFVLAAEGCVTTLTFYNPPPSCTGITPSTVTLEPQGNQGFSAAYTDGEGEISFYWYTNKGSFSSYSTNPTTYTAPSKFSTFDGEYININLQITDSLGRSDDCSPAVVTMSVPNDLPVCSSLTGSPSSGDRPLTTSFYASGSDADGYITAYEFDFGDGTDPLVITDSYTNHTYQTAGSYTASVRLQDNDEGWSEHTAGCQQAMTVSEPPIVPETYNTCESCACIEVQGSAASECSVDSDCACTPTCTSLTANPDSGVSPLTVNFLSAGLAGSGFIVEYAWDFGDGNTLSTTTSSTSYTYDYTGVYTATVRMKDSGGFWSEATPTCEASVLVSPQPPDPNQPPICSSLTASPLSGTFPLTVNLSASGGDSDGTISAYEFDFGDGTAAEYSESAATTHTYQSAGTFGAVVRLQDDDGLWSESTASCEATISVSSPPSPPVTHQVCENCACVAVAGAGSNACSVSSDCVCTPTCISLVASPNAGTVAPLEVSFSSVAAAPSGSLVEFSWDFGDGETTSTPVSQVSHSYLQEGSYTASVRMQDTSGAWTEKASRCEAGVVLSSASVPTPPTTPVSPPVGGPEATSPASPSAVPETGNPAALFYISLAVILFSAAGVLYLQFQPRTGWKWGKFENKF